MQREVLGDAGCNAWITVDKYVSLSQPELRGGRLRESKIDMEGAIDTMGKHLHRPP